MSSLNEPLSPGDERERANPEGNLKRKTARRSYAVSAHTAQPAGIEPLTVRAPQAAQLLNLPLATVYRLIRQGHLPALTFGTSRTVLISLAALRATVERGSKTCDDVTQENSEA